jgi:AraC family transcriptional regulator
MTLKAATRLDYDRRIARAMALIAADPARTPSLDELAAAAAFSPYHFHRIYRALAGETPAETLARTRLSEAASLLLRQGAMPVAEIARRCGYGSAAALTRAFRAAYGTPPAAYRRARGIGAPLPAPPTHNQEEEEMAMSATDRMSEVTIRELPALRLAAMSHTGPYTAIGAAFQRLQAWAGSRGLIGPESRFLGLYHDDPETVPAGKLRSAATLTVGPEVEADPASGVAILELPARRVATLRFKGPYAELESAYARLYRDWLPASGEEPADAPALEEYLNDCRSLPPAEWLTEIMLPLKG